MRFKLMALAATVSFAMPVVAQTDEAPAPASAPTKEKKTCRRAASTGSIIGGKVTCHTKSEWASIDAANTRNIDNAYESRNRMGRRNPDGSF